MTEINTPTLKFVNVLFRHGDRAPIVELELYPNDPHRKHNFDPPGSGNLTKSGEKRSYKLGKFLRKTYNNFLGTNCSSQSIAAQSPELDRAKKSISFVLMALCPETKVPVNYVSTVTDNVFFPQLNPRYKEEFKLIKELVDPWEKLETFECFMKKLSTCIGKTVKTARDMLNLYLTLEAEQYMNLTLPPWTEGIYPNGQLLNGALFEYELMNYNKDMIKRNGGMLVKKFIQDMKSVRKGTVDKDRKMGLYCAQDTNIVAVLTALGVFYPHVPKFCSAVIVELHVMNEIFYVKVCYYFGEPAEIIELQIPDCPVLCPLDYFVNLMKHVIPSD